VTVPRAAVADDGVAVEAQCLILNTVENTSPGANAARQ